MKVRVSVRVNINKKSVLMTLYGQEVNL